MGRNLLISAALALLINGCGSSVEVSELVTVPESSGQGNVAAIETLGTTEDENISVDGNNSVGKFVTTANVFIPEGTQPKDARGNPACIDDPCVITCDQKAPNNVDQCSEAEWQRLIDNGIPDIPTDHVVLYSGTLDVNTDNVISQVGAEVTIEVPKTALWPESTRWDKIHGIGCSDMKVWVTNSCEETDENGDGVEDGAWVATKIVQSCDSGTGKSISIEVDDLPAHIVMFVTMHKDHENLACCTGGGK